MTVDISGVESHSRFQQEAEKLEPPTAWYITKEFIEEAPIEVDRLHTYFEDNLSNEIRSRVAAPMEFWPPALKEVIAKSEGARDVVTELVDKNTELMRRALQQYYRCRFTLYTMQNPRPGEEEKPSRLSVEQATERLKANEVTLFWLGLEKEREVIDYLYQRAGAIPSTVK